MNEKLKAIVKNIQIGKMSQNKYHKDTFCMGNLVGTEIIVIQKEDCPCWFVDINDHWNWHSSWLKFVE